MSWTSRAELYHLCSIRKELLRGLNLSLARIKVARIDREYTIAADEIEDLPGIQRFDSVHECIEFSDSYDTVGG